MIVSMADDTTLSDFERFNVVETQNDIQDIDPTLNANDDDSQNGLDPEDTLIESQNISSHHETSSMAAVSNELAGNVSSLQQSEAPSTVKPGAMSTVVGHIASSVAPSTSTRLPPVEPVEMTTATSTMTSRTTVELNATSVAVSVTSVSQMFETGSAADQTLTSEGHISTSNTIGHSSSSNAHSDVTSSVTTNRFKSSTSFAAETSPPHVARTPALTSSKSTAGHSTLLSSESSSTARHVLTSQTRLPVTTSLFTSHHTTTAVSVKDIVVTSSALKSESVVQSSSYFSSVRSRNQMGMTSVSRTNGTTVAGDDSSVRPRHQMDMTSVSHTNATTDAGLGNGHVLSIPAAISLAVICGTIVIIILIVLVMFLHRKQHGCNHLVYRKSPGSNGMQISYACVQNGNYGEPSEKPGFATEAVYAVVDRSRKIVASSSRGDSLNRADEIRLLPYGPPHSDGQDGSPPVVENNALSHVESLDELDQLVHIDTDMSSLLHELDRKLLRKSATSGCSGSTDGYSSVNVLRNSIPRPESASLSESVGPENIYLAPSCHAHAEFGGPSWRPFHEYDSVYVPRNDAAGMARRVDNETSYVTSPLARRGVSPYEEVRRGQRALLNFTPMIPPRVTSNASQWQSSELSDVNEHEGSESPYETIDVGCHSK